MISLAELLFADLAEATIESYTERPTAVQPIADPEAYDDTLVKIFDEAPQFYEPVKGPLVKS